MSKFLTDEEFIGSSASASSKFLTDDEFLGTADSGGSFVPEVAKGVAAGAVEATGTALKGAAGQNAAMLQSRIDGAKARIHIMDLIDKGETVPVGSIADQDDLGTAEVYKTLSPEDRKAFRRSQEVVIEQAVKPGDVRDEPLYKAGQWTEDFSKLNFPPAKDYEGSWTRGISEGLGSTVPFIAAGAVGAGGVGLFAGSAMTAGSQIDDAIKHGATREQIIEAVKLGGIPGLTEQMPIEVLFSKIPLPQMGRFANALGKVLANAAAEGGQEGVQQLAQNLIAKYVYNPKQEISEDVLRSAAIGGIVGGGVKGVDVALGEPIQEKPSAKAGAGVAGQADAPTATEGAGGPPPPSAPSQDDRLDSPRLTPADRASPLPNDLIDDGRKIFEDALGKKAIDVPSEDIATPSMRAEAERRAADIATPASQAAASAIDHTIEGTLTPATAASAPGAAPARLLTDDEFMAPAALPPPSATVTPPSATLADTEMAAVRSTPVDELRKRDHYIEPSNTDKPTEDFPRLPLGSAKIGRYGDPKEAYVEVLREFNPNDLTSTEGEEDIKSSKTYRDYVQWFREGKEAPPIFVAESDKGDGKLFTTNRRRLLAAQEAGVTSIKGWFSPHNPKTGLPLKYKDVVAAAAPQIEPQKLTSAQTAEPAAQTALKQKIKAKRERAPIDLVQFLASEGGIVDHKGEIASLGMKGHFVPGIGKLMRETGMDLDRAREKAEEAGYIGKAGDYQTTTVADLLDALDKNMRGQRVYAREDAGRAENRAAEKAVKTNTEEQARQDDFDQMVKEFDLNDAETKQIQAAVERGEWASEAIVDILERRAIASEGKTRKSRTQKEPSVDDIPFDIGPAPKAGESAADASGGRKGPDAGRAERPAPAVEQPSKAERAGRSEEGGKGQGPLASLQRDDGAELSAEDRELLSVFPEGYRFVEGRGQLGRGHWGVASPEAPNTLIFNLHPTKAEAARVALSHMNSQANRQAEREAQDKWEKALAVRLLAGEEPTESAIQKLGLKPKAGFEWLSPVVQRLFGVSKMRVRQAMGDALKRGHSMGGTEFWVADAKKALMNAAAWVNAQSAPTVEPGADNKPQTVIPGAERISQATQAQREADKPMRPKVAQKDAGELFDDQARSERQGELFKLRATDAFRDQAQAIGKRLRAELDRIGLTDIGLRISENLGMMVEGKMHAADGQYFQKLITIALDAENPDATLQHEAIHALRELSLFGKDEWAILERQSRKKWMAEHKIAEAYGSFPEWVQVEEGIAHAYDAWYRSGAQYDGIIVKSFRKIKAVLRAIARAFGKDFTSFEDVFAKIESGEVGHRPGNVEFLSGGPKFQAAYHGTPHDFDEFSLEHIGKGEGAQAFGWGLYFAGKREIAEYYRKKLTNDQRDVVLKNEFREGVLINSRSSHDRYAGHLILEANGNVEKALELGRKALAIDPKSDIVRRALDVISDPKAEFRIIGENPGKLFKVDLPEDSELMQWDAPLNDQPPSVREKIMEVIDKLDPSERKRMEKWEAPSWSDAPKGAKYEDTIKASTIYSHLASVAGGDRAVSEALRAAGIPGHKFADNTSRVWNLHSPKAGVWEADNSATGAIKTFDTRAEAAAFVDSQKTHNYVIYDDSRVKVQEKFALRRAAAAPAPAQRRTTPPVSVLPNISTLASTVSTRIMNAIKGGPGKNDGESIGDYSMRKIVDYLHPLREMIDSVGPVADRVNAYLEARLALDSAVASIQDMHGKFVTPAVEALSRAGASLNELHQYLYALHAEERNRVVGLRNDPTSDFFKAVTDLNTVGASGWSTNHARQVLRQLRVDPQKFAGIQQAGRLVRQMLDENLLAQKNAGLISDASYNSLSQQWQNYVPLQAEDGIDENGDFSMPGRGRGFDVRGKEFKGATGRFTEAENIPAWAISATERSKLRQAKNRVGKSILRFINQYDPNGTNIAEVYWSDAPAGGFGNIQKAPPVYKRELDASGKVVNKAVPPSTIAPDMYATKVAGKTFYIKFADEKVGQALKNMNAVQMNFLFRLSRKITNFQSLVNTRINPAFTPTNFFRDVLTGGIHLLDEGFSGIESAKILGNIPTAWGALWRAAKGRPGTGPMDTALAELTKAGGRLIFEQQKTVEESIKSLHKQMAAASTGKGSPQALWQGFVKLVGDINDTVEMGIRLSAYVAARAKGKTVKQAAFMIRDLTVDFRKHGEVGPTGNALYTFFNASVQGNFNVASRLLGSRKVQAAAATIMLSGFMMDMLNRSLSGDDDDGENLYEKMLKNEPWKFERQMVIFYGPGKGSYFTIPLPYGYNAIYHAGVQTSAAANGDVTSFQAMSSTMRVMVDAFNPMGGGGGWINMFSPTVLDPLIEIDRNKNFADIPIYPTTYPGDTTPDSQQSFGNTPDVFKWAAEQTNALTGGNKIEPGAVDIHPDTIEHMWDFVSGGLGRFFGQVADPLVKAGTGRSDDIAIEKLPFVRSFYGEQGDDNKRSEYFNKREAVQTAKSRLSDYKAAGDAAETQDFIERNQVDVKSIPAFDAAEKRLRKIRKQRRRIEAEGGDTSALDEAERKVMTQARLAYARNAAKAR